MNEASRVRVSLGIVDLSCSNCKHYPDGWIGCKHPKWRPGAGPCHDFHDGIKLIERNGPMGFWEERDEQ